MSVSDNSTIAPSSDVDGSLQSLDDGAKKTRGMRRVSHSAAPDSLDGSEISTGVYGNDEKVIEKS